MKKYSFLIIILCIMGATPLWAQYHITGDTIQYMDSIYWRPDWVDTLVDPANIPHESFTFTYGFPQSPGAEWLMKHTVDHPIRVIGIACAVAARYQHWPEDLVQPVETSVQEYLRIYRRKRDSTDVPLRSIPWDPTAPHRYLNCQSSSARSPHDPSIVNCDSITYGYPYVHPVYEVYFEDNPLVIVDSFCIGMTNHSGGIWDCIYPMNFSMYGNPPCGIRRELTYILIYDSNGVIIPAGQPTEYTTWNLWYIFPILSQDTDFSLLDSCPAVGNVWIDTAGGGSVLRWDTDTLHARWRLGISDTGDAHNTLYLDTLLEVPYINLDSLGIEPPFSVQVRPQCLCYEYCEVWGDWGDCTEFLPAPVPDTCRPVENLQFVRTGRRAGTLTWIPDTIQTLWEVSVGLVDGDVSDTFFDTLVTVPFLDIDSTMAPAVFTAHVRAICGEDNLSDWVSVTVDGTDTCRPVENLQFVRTGRRAGTLTWIPDTLQSLWQVSVGLVDRDVSEAFFDTLVTAPFLDIDSSMAPTVFTAHVRAICGEDYLSVWVSVTADPYVSVSQTMAPDIQLVPNPADGLVRVVSSDGLRGIEVYDMTGRRMLAFTATSTEVSFNVSDWSAGTYIVILRTIAGASVQRLVVE